jgi:pimeloyl-ACP methyl ester carboxylesterase
MSVDLHAVVRGRGPDVVLVHGALGDCRQWDDIATALADRYRVHAISRRHHWPAEMPAADAPYTYEIHRDDVIGYLSHLDGPAHLVGHSYGAGIVLMAALAAAQPLRTLTAIEPAFGSLLPADDGLAEERVDRIAGLAAVKALSEAGQDAAAVEGFIDWVQGGPGGFATLPASVQSALRQNARTLPPMMAAPQPDVTAGALAALAVPTVVVNGEHTRPWYRVIGEATAAAIPGARLERLAGCRHMTIVERPGDAAALLAGVFASAGNC